jgi:hypothetical protein
MDGHGRARGGVHKSPRREGLTRTTAWRDSSQSGWASAATICYTSLHKNGGAAWREDHG